MVTYEYESFVFNTDSARDPADLADVFLAKAEYGGVARVGNEVYDIETVNYSFKRGRALLLSQPDDHAAMRITTDDGVLMTGDDILSDSVELITSCSNCHSNDVSVDTKTEATCNDCGTSL